MSSNDVTILLSSAGRRPYLVEWFQEALRLNNIQGKILVVDADPYAASRAFTDNFLVMPSVLDEDYETKLSEVLRAEHIDLAISLNDFELSLWAGLDSNFPGGDALLRLDPSVQQIVEDKLETAEHLANHAVPVPQTLTAKEAISNISELKGEYITKGRYGSASRGLRVSDVAELPETANEAVREVTDSSGQSADPADPGSLELVVVQPRIIGQEYGLDIVCDLEGRYVSTLARRKISMRAGETDRAESVDSTSFEHIGRSIAEAIPHRGSIDVDVLIDSDGAPWVIDINPRFGGGYPFSHLAGANLPAAYIAWVAGAHPDPAWLISDPGVVSSKFVGVTRS